AVVSNPSVRAVFITSLSSKAVSATPTLPSTPSRRRSGTISRRSSTRLPTRSRLRLTDRWHCQQVLRDWRPDHFLPGLWLAQKQSDLWPWPALTRAPAQLPKSRSDLHSPSRILPQFLPHGHFVPPPTAHQSGGCDLRSNQVRRAAAREQKAMARQPRKWPHPGIRVFALSPAARAPRAARRPPRRRAE